MTMAAFCNCGNYTPATQDKIAASAGAAETFYSCSVCRRCDRSGKDGSI